MMFDFIAIFSKGGFVLWCIENTGDVIVPAVNALISTAILQERSGNHTFDHESISVHYKLDNEFGLVFVLGFQKVLQLAYADKFLSDIHRMFRDKFKQALSQSKLFQEFPFEPEYKKALTHLEKLTQHQQSNKSDRSMRTFTESSKSQKTVGSMIIDRKGELAQTQVLQPKLPAPLPKKGNLSPKPPGKVGKKSPKAAPTRDGKKPRIWENNGKNIEGLDRSSGIKSEENNGDYHGANSFAPAIKESMRGEIRSLTNDGDSESEEDEAEEEKTVTKPGVFNYFSNLVMGRKLTATDLQPPLDKLRDHLIAKNVATDVAGNLCNSIGTQLEGKSVGTFQGVAGMVRRTLIDALVQILSPKRRLDILRDVEDAKCQRRPYVVVFCGVNGVGKSTNLAKVSYWLMENDYRILVAAGDTFRAGAVEQLRTHVHHLSALHPPQKHGGQQMVQLFERGYGKDAAGIAMEAIRYAKDNSIDVVLVDTAGRMQDNQPLMIALAKLISVNNPDLVLFVGEALVGNEAVDQLLKFNRALADYSSQEQPHQLDGIVLTKFDTIDDKVGAAVSMSYLTGQPIVFVGTGQTYSDLRSLNAKTVVTSLMK